MRGGTFLAALALFALVGLTAMTLSASQRLASVHVTTQTAAVQEATSADVSDTHVETEGTTITCTEPYKLKAVVQTDAQGNLDTIQQCIDPATGEMGQVRYCDNTSGTEVCTTIGGKSIAEGVKMCSGLASGKDSKCLSGYLSDREEIEPTEAQKLADALLTARDESKEGFVLKTQGSNELKNILLSAFESGDAKGFAGANEILLQTGEKSALTAIQETATQLYGDGSGKNVAENNYLLGLRESATAELAEQAGDIQTISTASQSGVAVKTEGTLDTKDTANKAGTTFAGGQGAGQSEAQQRAALEARARAEAAARAQAEAAARARASSGSGSLGGILGSLFGNGGTSNSPQCQQAAAYCQYQRNAQACQYYSQQCQNTGIAGQLLNMFMQQQQQEEQENQQQEEATKYCTDKYPGTKLVDGRCACPNDQIFTDGQCRNACYKYPGTKLNKKNNACECAGKDVFDREANKCIPITQTGPLQAELSCTPNVADVGQDISLRFACSGATVARGNGFETGDKLTGTTTVKADIDESDPERRGRIYGLVCGKMAQPKMRVVRCVLLSQVSW